MFDIAAQRGEAPQGCVRGLGTGRASVARWPCPLWIKSGHRPADQRCPLCPRKQTCSASNSMSATLCTSSKAKGKISDGKEASFYGQEERGQTKAKEMRRRASQRRATHRARRAALTFRAEMRRAAEAEKVRRSSGPKGHVKSTVKAGKTKKK
jgi:hypothetical protein